MSKALAFAFWSPFASLKSLCFSSLLSLMSERMYIFRKEISAIQKKNAIQASVDGLQYSVMVMAALVSIVTMVLTGQTLTPVNVFVLLSYINVLKQVTCIRLANGFFSTYDGYVSLGRIEDFLLLKNLEEDSTTEKSSSAEQRSCYTERQTKINQVPAADEVKDLDKPTSLCVSNLTFKQSDREDEFILQDIEFVARSQSLTVITGPVGSGKSTLLSAIAGE